MSSKVTFHIKEKCSDGPNAVIFDLNFLFIGIEFMHYSYLPLDEEKAYFDIVTTQVNYHQ